MTRRISRTAACLAGHFVDTNEAAALVDAQKAGVRVWQIPPADQAALKALLDPAVQNGAKGLDERHLPGSQVLADFKANLT